MHQMRKLVRAHALTKLGILVTAADAEPVVTTEMSSAAVAYGSKVE